ncbi:MAG: metallophosphoesterase [Gemmatimonadaceae bacterium]
MNRRKFMGASAALVTGGAGVIGYATLIEPHWLQLVTRDLKIANLPPGLHGAKLAHVSDIHVCSYVNERYLTESLRRLDPFAPDIVAFTGDFVSWEPDRPDNVKIAQLRRVLSNLPHGRLATVGILGNHDYGNTWRDAGIGALITDVVSGTGMRVLRNEVATVAGLDIVGIDDLWSGRADTQLALEERRSGAAIALCHNPDSLDDLSWEGYSGWILAGHTHGGQCKPPFLPPPVLPVKNKRYSSGEIAVDADRALYISRGVGHLLKARFNVRPEITVFTLKPEKAPGGPLT